jgi:hypothetical protein
MQEFSNEYKPRPTAGEVRGTDGDEDKRDVSDTCSYIGELVAMLENDAHVPQEAIDHLLERRSNPENMDAKEKLSGYQARITHQEYRLIALRAVRQDGMFLENYPGLCHDREIVGAACLQNQEALQFASDDIRDDEGFVLPILNRKPDVIIYCSLRVRTKYRHLHY